MVIALEVLLALWALDCAGRQGEVMSVARMFAGAAVLTALSACAVDAAPEPQAPEGCYWEAPDAAPGCPAEALPARCLAPVGAAVPGCVSVAPGAFCCVPEDSDAEP